jgi:hypothetical protein
MPSAPQRKQPNPEGEFSESKNYNTGYRTVYHEINVPGRQSGEPHAIRAQATETSPNQWMVKVVHGPHDERDLSGSYYKSVGDFSHSGSMSSLKSKLKSTTRDQWKGLRA